MGRAVAACGRVVRPYGWGHGPAWPLRGETPRGHRPLGEWGEAQVGPLGGGQRSAGYGHVAGVGLLSASSWWLELPPAEPSVGGKRAALLGALGSTSWSQGRMALVLLSPRHP